MAENTKTMILDQTLKIISKEGVKGVTVRKIARLCNVNIASINYHFRTKENLIEEALKLFGNKMGSIFLELETLPLSPEEKLYHFLSNFSQSQIQYPGFLQLEIDKIFNGKEMNSRAVQNMSSGRKILLGILKTITREKSEQKLSMMLFQLISSILFPVLYGRYVNEIYHFDIFDHKTREKYIKLAIKNVCANRYTN